jgi:ABC-type multidrug transport system ATPase subunit
MTALMGSTGAGKTTLMDVLSARKNQGTHSGDICFNGKSIFEVGSGFKSIMVSICILLHCTIVLKCSSQCLGLCGAI